MKNNKLIAILLTVFVLVVIAVNTKEEPDRIVNCIINGQAVHLGNYSGTEDGLISVDVDGSHTVLTNLPCVVTK